MGRNVRGQCRDSVRGSVIRENCPGVGAVGSVSFAAVDGSYRDFGREIEMSRYVIGLVTCASRVEARKLAQAVLTQKLAACVNIVAGVESHFWWKGKLDRANEFLLVIKTTGDKTKEITKVIQAKHSYEVPEIIFTAIASGERRYLRWLRTALGIFLITALACRADDFDDLGSTNEEIRAEAAGKIAQTGGLRAVQTFREMLNSGSSERRQMAVIGLLQVSDAEEDLNRVKEKLSDENSTVRWSAALALGQSGWTNAVPVLEVSAKKDKSADVREAAGEALKKLRAKLAGSQQMIQEAHRQPGDVEANWRVAEAYLTGGREDLAEPYLRNVIAHDDENRYGHTDRAIFALGFAFGKAGKHARAVYCMEQLLKRWPQFTDRDKALYCLGLSQLAGGQKENGRATLAALTGEFPESAVGKAGQQVLEKLGAK